jgi:GGDEF domain-containing protein
LPSTGRFRQAYQEHRAFHAEATALHSSQREARTRALQAVFEATEVTTSPDGRGTPSSLLSQADHNLYAAKRGGRDRVVIDTQNRISGPASG